MLYFPRPNPTQCYMYCLYHITPNANMPTPNGRIIYPLASGNATSRPYPVKTHRTPGQSSHRVVVVLYSSDLAAMFPGKLIIYRRHLSGSASRYRCRCHSCCRARVAWAAVLAAFGLCCYLGPHSTCLSGARCPSHLHLSHHFRLDLSAGCL